MKLTIFRGTWARLYQRLLFYLCYLPLAYIYVSLKYYPFQLRNTDYPNPSAVLLLNHFNHIYPTWYVYEVMKLNITNFLSFSYAHAIIKAKILFGGRGWGTQQIFIQGGSAPLNPFLSEELDQFRFPGNCSPTPPLSHHFALGER